MPKAKLCPSPVQETDNTCYQEIHSFCPQSHFKGEALKPLIESKSKSHL
jgi:hypothetical protein